MSWTRFVRVLVPRSIKERVRDRQARYYFDRGMWGVSRIANGAAPSASVLNDLVRGWGNHGWSAREELYRAIIVEAWRARGPMLDCGSGLSTVLLGAIGQRMGRKVFALEHQTQWADRVRHALDRYHLDNVEVCVAPLASHGAYSWYDVSALPLPNDIALVVCDGPPGDTPGGRYGFYPVMRARLLRGCVVLLDDVDRRSERESIMRWASDVGMPYDVCGERRTYARLVLDRTPEQRPLSDASTARPHSDLTAPRSASAGGSSG